MMQMAWAIDRHTIGKTRVRLLFPGTAMTLDAYEALVLAVYVRCELRRLRPETIRQKLMDPRGN
jgi:hypothetical protein